MSDTGHTRKPTPWTWYEDDGWFLVVRDDPSRIILEGVKAVSSTADVHLIADAPLLLEEVERLRAWKKLVSDIVQLQDGSHLREMLKELIV